MKQTVGIIGGSGLYEMEGIRGVTAERITTPFGEPSDAFMTGDLDGKTRVVFLSRHGKGHRLLPTEINYRANIYGMKMLGATRILSVSAVGSLKKEYRPRDIVIPDQFVDRTNQARKGTFFGDGCVAHIPFGTPVCPYLSALVAAEAKKESIRVHPKGTYVNMEGPAFSTKAESHLYRSWGMDVVGMTNLYEAKLAREAEICYVTMAMVTDYDCWLETEGEVNVKTVIGHLSANVANAKKIIRRVIPMIKKERSCLCAKALESALLTDRAMIPAEIKKKLQLIIGKYL